MLGLNYDDHPYRVVGIDPGTNTLGVAVLDIQLATNEIALLDARTFVGQSMLDGYRKLAAVHGDRMARLMAHEDNLVRYFQTMTPHSIISESPFLGRFPATFAALTECMTTIRRAVWRYEQELSLLLVDPPTAKMAVGLVIRRGMDKEDVKQAILRLTALQNPTNLDLAALDEHSIDAIAVAFTRAKFIVEQNAFEKR